MALSSFANGRLWGARYGSGRPWALALHGWGRDHHDFDRVLDGIDAIALDLPGFGVVPEPPLAWATQEYASHIAPVLDDMTGGPVVVIGHSFGARVAVYLAEQSASAPAPAPAPASRPDAAASAAGPATRPDPAGVPAGPATQPGLARPATDAVSPRRVGALVLTGAPLAPPPGRATSSRPAFAYRAGAALHKVGLVSDDRMEGLRRKYGSEDYRRATPTMRGVLVKAVRETASAAYLPALAQWVATGGDLELVWGEGDTVASLAGTQAALANQVGGAALGNPPRVTVVPAAGHLINKDLAAELRAAILRHQPSSSTSSAGSGAGQRAPAPSSVPNRGTEP